MTRAEVDVALATYNGARFLPELLASIRRQAWPGLRIVACDDRSTDATVAILRQNADLVALTVENPSNLGPCANFAKALGLTSADYVIMADQDDVWLPGKIDKLMAAVSAAERAHGAATPIAVFSDLRVVDRDLEVLDASFFAGALKSSAARQVRDFTISNHVPGCVMLVNRALVDLALPVPDDVYMHDWWFCLVAAACGEIVHVAEPLVLFRRHGGNATGESRAKVRGAFLAKAKRRLRQPLAKIALHWWWLNRWAYYANVRLAVLDRRYRDRMSPAAREQVDALRSPSLRRRLAALHAGVSGESATDTFLIAARMGAARNRPSLPAS